ncbi:MAG: hypothetical protein ACXACP_14130 [Candidatus Hodarchaeales archaeon]|jgi:hypothetical protein
MDLDTWLKNGIESFEKQEWFDGIQLIQGALQRSFRRNLSENVKNIIKFTSEFLIPAEKSDLYCQLALSTILPIGKRSKDQEWLTLLPLILGIIVDMNKNSCLAKFNKKIIETKYFHEDVVLEFLQNNISSEKHEIKLKAELYYLLACLQVSMQLYPECYETLTQWNSDSPSSSQILTYLTLAELNAFEIDDCGQYLIQAKKSNSQSEYIEFTSQLFKSIELKDYELYLSITRDYRDILNTQKDIFLVRLIEGITDFMKPKDSKNLFSLFGGR